MKASSYPFEKFFNAVSGMATSTQPLRDRIASASSSFIAVKESDFKDPDALAAYRDLMERFRKVQDPSRGSIKASLEAMTDMEVREAGDLIVSILHQLILAD